MITSDDTVDHAAALLSPADLAQHHSANFSEPWERADHLNLINEAILMAYKGVIKRIAAFLPPRYGKSMLVSKYTPAWWLLQRPDDRVIITSYNDELATGSSAYARDVIDQLGDKLCGIKRKPGTYAKDNWEIEDHAGGVRATSIGGGISGYGADLFIVDDPVKDAKDGRSPAFQKNNWSWWQSAATPRFEPGGVVLFIQTRWHQLDLGGQVLDHAKSEPDSLPWVVIRFPEWADHDELDPVKIVGGANNVTPELTDWVESKRSNKSFRRKKGEILWPARWSLQDVKGRKGECTEQFWQAVHQQNPQPESGILFKAKYFTIVDTSPVDALRVRYWDLAATAGGGDYLAGVQMSYAPGDKAFYIEDVVRGQWDAGEVDANVLLAATLDGYNVAIRIEQEPGASGKLVIAHFKRLLGDYDVDGRRANGPKITRWQRMLAPMEHSIMYLVKGPWNRDFINELLILPAGAHDDQADAAAGAYAELVNLDRLSPNVETL